MAGTPWGLQIVGGAVDVVGHAALSDVQQVGRIIVHPTDPDVVFVAGLGHPYGPNEERGVFRTRDGGATRRQLSPASSER